MELVRLWGHPVGGNDLPPCFTSSCRKVGGREGEGLSKEAGIPEGSHVVVAVAQASADRVE